MRWRIGYLPGRPYGDRTTLAAPLHEVDPAILRLCYLHIGSGVVEHSTSMPRKACRERTMKRSSNTIEVYLENGKKRMFAGVVDWPGWCRGGRDEGRALQALLDYGPRYAHVLHAAHIGFQAPTENSAFVVVERLQGNATTDFGAPSIAPAGDARSVADDELARFQTLLGACWRAFDAVVRLAQGRELRKGPRGGGRDLKAIVKHVLDADAAYLGRLAWKFKKREAESPSEDLGRTRTAVLSALIAAVQGQTPERGPRGGAIWRPRYFVRRVAWHVLDHTWEIEDRVV